MNTRALLLAFFLAAGLLSSAKAADNQPIQTSGLSGADLKTVGIEQHIGQEIPRNLLFTDSKGDRINFSDLVGRKPTLLALVYYDCPNLCTLVLNATVSSVADLRRTVGDGFQIVVVSIDPTETPALAAEKKAGYLLRYSRGHDQDKEWSFLVGDEANIHQLADAVGYQYRYDPAIHQFAHGSGIVMLDGQGRIVKYFLGIEYPPAEIEKAIQYAHSGQVGTPSPNFLLLCYCYNPLTGPYGFLIFTLLKIGAFVTVAALVAFIVRSIRREAHKEAI